MRRLQVAGRRSVPNQRAPAGCAAPAPRSSAAPTPNGITGKETVRRRRCALARATSAVPSTRASSDLSMGELDPCDASAVGGRDRDRGGCRGRLGDCRAAASLPVPKRREASRGGCAVRGAVLPAMSHAGRALAFAGEGPPAIHVAFTGFRAERGARPLFSLLPIRTTASRGAVPCIK